jgi:hypothetical protein
MLNKEALRQALTRRDARQVQALLKSEPQGPADCATLLESIKQTGCLINRFGKEANADVQKAIVRAACDYLSWQDLDYLERLKFHVQDSAFINLIFRRIKDAVGKLDISALSPETQAWSVIDWAGSHLSVLLRRALSPLRKPPFLVRAGASSTYNADGSPIDMDAALGQTEECLRMALSMLAFDQDWWDEEGKLCLPRRRPTDPEQIDKAGGHIYLASIWDLVVGASETLRFWGRKITFGDIPLDNNSPDTFPTLLFDLDLNYGLYFAISRMRMMQTEIDIQMAKLGVTLPKFKDPSIQQIAMPPSDFVSSGEMATAIMLDMLYHYELDSSVFSGALSPAKLIRGYAVLKRCFERPLKSAKTELALLDRAKLERALRNSALTEQETEVFFDTIAFGRDSRDLFDCPVIRSESGEEFLLQGFLQFASLPSVVVSRLGSYKVDFGNKGAVFERQVLELFTENAIPAKELKFWINSDEYQVDVVVVWRNIVFLFECKNFLLPAPSAAQEFHFMESMNEAVDQVLRLKVAVEENPSELPKHFPDVCLNPEIIPVVLNALPFSMNSQLRGVFLYDFSALNRFFAGKVSVNQPIYSNRKWIHVEHLIKSLWAGTAPEPEDLIAQMKSPIQLEAELPRWYTDYVTLGITNQTAMRIPVLKKKDTSSADMLETLGVDDHVAGFLNQISSGLHQALGGKRKSKKRRPNKRRR